jgi:hypothetical protein
MKCGAKTKMTAAAALGRIDAAVLLLGCGADPRASSARSRLENSLEGDTISLFRQLLDQMYRSTLDRSRDYRSLFAAPSCCRVHAHACVPCLRDAEQAERDLHQHEAAASTQQPPRKAAGGQLTSAGQTHLSVFAAQASSASTSSTSTSSSSSSLSSSSSSSVIAAGVAHPVRRTVVIQRAWRIQRRGRQGAERVDYLGVCKLVLWIESVVAFH